MNASTLSLPSTRQWLMINTVQPGQKRPVRLSLKRYRSQMKPDRVPISRTTCSCRDAMMQFLPSANNHSDPVSGAFDAPSKGSSTSCSPGKTMPRHLEAPPSIQRNRNGTIGARSLDCRIQPLVQRWANRNSNIAPRLGSRFVRTSVSSGV
jgi:hypothetical protein